MAEDGTGDFFGRFWRGDIRLPVMFWFWGVLVPGGSAGGCSGAVRSRRSVVLVDRLGELLRAATLAELQRLAVPASTLDRHVRRERDRLGADWERRLAGETLIVDASLGGVADGMLDEKADDEADAADSTDDWRQSIDPASQAEAPLIKYRVEEVVANGDGEGLRPADLTDWRHVRTLETHRSESSTVLRGLADNRVPDVEPLSDLSALRRLDLGGNPAADLSPVGDLGTLVWLRVPASAEAPAERLVRLRWLWRRESEALCVGGGAEADRQASFPEVDSRWPEPLTTTRMTAPCRSWQTKRVLRGWTIGLKVTGRAAITGCGPWAC